MNSNANPDRVHQIGLGFPPLMVEFARCVVYATALGKRLSTSPAIASLGECSAPVAVTPVALGSTPWLVGFDNLVHGLVTVRRTVAPEQAVRLGAAQLAARM